ncbi:hypothetical protein [Sphingomonas sp. NFR04]|uniref:hypothetical protein n=1 Tax=Sphingomonas sp. NFR04 TaxID=1566283 RepID=UPI00158749ED|nr:hypothetical protein [Sphingomonas sp. NFR04]
MFLTRDETGSLKIIVQLWCVREDNQLRISLAVDGADDEVIAQGFHTLDEAQLKRTLDELGVDKTLAQLEQAALPPAVTNAQPAADSEPRVYFDCGQCGEIGKVADLKQHATRPMPDDIGFCPKCRVEVDDVLNETEVRERLREYDEDPDAFLAKLGAG